MNKVVGYFYWVKDLKGVTSPVKLDADIAAGLLPDSKKNHEASIVPGSKRELNEAQWSLSLSQLAATYTLSKKGGGL